VRSAPKQKLALSAICGHWLNQKNALLDGRCTSGSRQSGDRPVLLLIGRSRRSARDCQCLWVSAIWRHTHQAGAGHEETLPRQASCTTGRPVRLQQPTFRGGPSRTTASRRASAGERSRWLTRDTSGCHSLDHRPRKTLWQSQLLSQPTLVRRSLARAKVAMAIAPPSVAVRAPRNTYRRNCAARRVPEAAEANPTDISGKAAANRSRSASDSFPQPPGSRRRLMSAVENPSSSAYASRCASPICLSAAIR
jgi:hypothetical protein